MSEKVDVEEFNADELQPPSWLNSQFITQVLSAYKKTPELEVTDLKISPATAQGDHYASVMFRTKVEYTTSKGSFHDALIVKTMPEEDCHKKELLGESHLFATEIGMYTKVLPEFERILQEAGDNTKLYVPCVYHSLEPRQVIIFEDLVPQGYSVLRGRSASEEELKTVYTKLAKIHAVSMKVNNEQPDFLKDFKYGMTDMTGLMTNPMITSGMGNFINMLDKTPELRKYKPHFEKIEENYFQRQAEVMQEYRRNPRPDGLYVLAHGDFHLRNMMFKHNPGTGAFEDVMLLDYQISNLAPPTLDLTYSFYFILDSEQRWSLKEKLISLYFSVFTETLSKIQFKGTIPTKDCLWELIRRHKYLDFFLVVTFLAIVLAAHEKAFKLEDLVKDNEARKKSFFLPKTIEDFRKILTNFDEQGYFDNL